MTGPHGGDRRLVVVAIGGNAISPRSSGATADEQIAALQAAARTIASATADVDLVLTHGNGPQVGNLVRKNELATAEVPAVPLDWCVAQTQATIGLALATALEHELAIAGVGREVRVLLSRVEVDPDDRDLREPSKPIGVAGSRRLVPSPRPRRCLELGAVRRAVDDGAIVIVNGGGGVAVVPDDERGWRGVEAVIDKDRSAAHLAVELGADQLVILTDVPGVAVDYGAPGQRWLTEVTTVELAALASAGAFGAGSMGPKVEAAVTFVDRTGGVACIAAVDQVDAALAGRAGTRVCRGVRP